MVTTKARQDTFTQTSLIAPETNCLCEDDPDGNYAADTRLSTRVGKGRSSRVIVRFDLTGIPPNATVLSAVFGIYEESIRNDSQAITLCRLTESWSELASSWNKRDGIYNWTVPGGTCDNTPLGSLRPTSIGFKTFDVTDMVRDWLNGTYNNNGFILVAKMTEDTVGLEPREQEQVNFEAPYLDLIYTSEGTVPKPVRASDRWPIWSSCAVPTPNKGQHRRLRVILQFLPRIVVRLSM